MTTYPPDGDSEAVNQFMTNADTIISWSASGEGDRFSASTLKANMDSLEYVEESGEWRIHVELPHPIDSALWDPDLSNRAREVMEALAEGKEVSIHDE